MKKFFTSLTCALLCAATSLAAVTVTRDGVALQNGETITLTKKDFKVQQFGPMTRITCAVELTVTADQSPINFYGETDNPKIQCCPTGSCIAFGSEPNADGMYTGRTTVDGPTVQCPVDIAMMQASAEIPEMLNKINVTINPDTFGEFKFTVVFDTKSEASVDGIGTAAEALTVSGNTLHYTVPAETLLTVFDLSGNSVMNATLNASGTLDLSALPAGIYILATPNRSLKVTLPVR